MVAGESGRPNGAQSMADQSTAQLVQHASEQMSRLVRDEIALARAELADKGRHAGRGAGLFGGGAVFALYGLGALILAAILGLAQAMSGWLAALLVGVALLIIAGALVLLGWWQLQGAMPPVPAAATRSMRADVGAVATAVRERGAS